MFEYSKIYYYRYYPKTIGTIHIYDMYPLMIPLEIKGITMIGINLHWIPGPLRNKMVQVLVELRKKSINENMFRLWYRMIKQNPALSFALVAVRKYYLAHCSSIKVVDSWEQLTYISNSLYRARYMKRSAFTPTRHIVIKSKYHPQQQVAPQQQVIAPQPQPQQQVQQ